jgi:phenylalanyl-tRNA synthetase beta chain
MLVPVEWLKDYTDVNVNVEEFCEKMIMSGSNLETCQYFGDEIKDVIIGKIVRIENHPDADKLLICYVETGEDELTQIVTGAENVFEGAFIPVAIHGSKLPGNKKISKGKLRGVESNGMLCSMEELGFEDKVVPTSQRGGIWILNGLIPDDEWKLGQDLVEVLGLKTSVVDFEITPNRPDCLCMIGMARESAATFGGKLKYPEIRCEEETGSAGEYISVEIKKPELCRRYVARVVTDVVIKESPWWLQKRLMLAGMRPINNIVDITNFVMLEYGNPIHAFDIRCIEGSKIIVDTAEQGEIFISLDGSERKLNDDMLLIKDSSKGVAIAGVMGGQNSEILQDTNTILIEAANFNGDSIRLTSKKLGLRTEASSRFEKGIDPNLCEAAADRVCRLIEILDAGKVVSGSVDVYPSPSTMPMVEVRVARVNSVLGIQASKEEMTKIFESLEMKVEGNEEIMKTTPPSIRQDLIEEVDFIEEIARMYGYDKMPMTLPRGNQEARKSRERQLKDLARQTMCALGANEVQTYSFVSPKGVDYVRIDEDSWERNFVKIINPLGEENSVMRTILTPNMMEILGRNFSRNIDKVRAYEIGNTFTQNLIEAEGLPDEQDSMVIASYGKDESFFTLKGMIVELLSIFGIEDIKFESENEYGVYHPGRCARILLNDIELGIMGEVHPEVCDKYGIGTKCFCCELMFDTVMNAANTEKFYRPLPKYPSTSRDIALLVDEDVQVGTLEAIIKENGADILEKLQLFDVYRGKQIGEGKKSVAFALTYRAADKTLADEDVAIVHNKVLIELKDKAKATLREI